MKHRYNWESVNGDFSGNGKVLSEHPNALQRKDDPNSTAKHTAIDQQIIPTRLNNLQLKPCARSGRVISEDKAAVANGTRSVSSASSPPDSESTESAQQGALLPPDFSPTKHDIIVTLPPSLRSRPGIPTNDSLTSVDFELMLHRLLLRYIKATPVHRGEIIDKIISTVSKRGGFFIRWEDSMHCWVTACRKTARDFTARELKVAARDVLAATLRSKRRREEDTSIGAFHEAACGGSPCSSFSRQQKRTRYSETPSEEDETYVAANGSHVLQAKFKRPKSQSVPQLSPNSAAGALSPLEVLSHVAASHLQQ